MFIAVTDFDSHKRVNLTRPEMEDPLERREKKVKFTFGDSKFSHYTAKALCKMINDVILCSLVKNLVKMRVLF